MSDPVNHIEYIQISKLYDECLHYLKENHEDLQPIIEVEEPSYETIKEQPTNYNKVIEVATEDKIKNNGVNIEKKANGHILGKEQSKKSDEKYSNASQNYNDGMKIIDIDNESENCNDIDAYGAMNTEVMIPDDKITNASTQYENKQMALVKYDESRNILHETFNSKVELPNSNLKEDNIKIIINNNQVEDIDENNDSDDKLDYRNEENNRKEIATSTNVEHLEHSKPITFGEGKKSVHERPVVFKLENEVKSTESLTSVKSERLRKLSQQLPKIIITHTSTTSLDAAKNERKRPEPKLVLPRVDKSPVYNITRTPQVPRAKRGYGEFPKRLVSKTGLENVALITNVPFEKIRLLNDTFHTLINLRWRWIVIGTVVVHFLIWLVFAMFWYITALAHYDFEPDPPKRSCVTGGKDFVTIFLASVEAQTTIGFGDRTIDEECPEAIFLFIMQLILGTGLSGVLTCVVYAKLTRPEKLSRDGVGFSKKAVISMRDGNLCLMIRAWDLNYDHIIGSEFAAHFISTQRTKEGEVIRYYAQSLALQHRQFLLWPVTLVHIIDRHSPLYRYGPDIIHHSSYEITVSLKGASASMGTFTQSQTSYLPKEIVWGHRFPPVVKYDCRKQKYVIDHNKLDVTEAVATPHCSAEDMDRSTKKQADIPIAIPNNRSSFNEKMSVFQLGRTSSFRKKNKS